MSALIEIWSDPTSPLAVQNAVHALAAARRCWIPESSGLSYDATVPAAPAQALDLQELDDGCPALTPPVGGGLREAASVCLARRHQSGVRLRVGGDHESAYLVHWPDVTEQMRRTHNDPQDATEQGACGVAILLVKRITGLTIVERSRKGTGFDYWLGNDDNLFQNKARLEVSGILNDRGKSSKVTARVRRKEKQTKRSDASQLSAHVVVVEFGRPVAHYAVRP